jgi:hypothetical protein
MNADFCVYSCLFGVKKNFAKNQKKDVDKESQSPIMPIVIDKD